MLEYFLQMHCIHMCTYEEIVVIKHVRGLHGKIVPTLEVCSVALQQVATTLKADTLSQEQEA